jgi:phosphatidylserine/phosphatidylglycerophosphate/cardiolipin synthase-like enzyme
MIGDISLPREKVVEYSPWHKLMQDQYILLKKIPDKAPFAKWIKSDSGKSQVIEYSLHEKMLIIDGERAIAGGRNIADNYYFWWKDTDLYMEGPIVDAVNKEFLANWTEFGGQPPKTTQAMNLHTDKGLPASLADSKPWKGNFSTQEMLCKAIGMSEKSVYITTQFIALPDSLGQALKAAASRGIDVRILTNSYETGQEVAYSLCHYISLNHYRELMAAGVRIYEYQSPPGAKQKPYYHTKQFIIDGLWTSIGSFNLSVRSAYIESELQINIPDGAFSGTRQDVFLKTLSESSSEVSFENYAREEDRFGPLMGAAKLVELLY